MIRHRAALAAVLLTVAAGLSGCISLFPKTKPVNLYRLAPAPAAASAVPATAPKVVVLRAPTYFTRVSAGDLIVTRTGLESASIAGARWATPVQLMFDEALSAAFDSSARVNLITRGSPAPPDLTLRVEVTTFEAEYTNGEGSAPTANVTARLSIIPLKDGGAPYETVISAKAQASDNRVGPIVEALNAATAELLAKIVSETEARAATVRRSAR